MFALSPSFNPTFQNIEESFLSDVVSGTKEKLSSYFSNKFEKFPEKIKEIEKTLINGGINVSKIKKDAKMAATKANVNEKKIFNFKEILNVFVSDFSQKKYFIGSLSAENEENVNSNELSPAQKIFASLGILATVLFLNYFFYGIALKFVGSSAVAYKICTIFIYPLIEEYGKRFSVKHNLTGIYFTIFTIQELIRYALTPMGSIIGTIPQILMHALTTGIHAVAKKNDSMLGYWVSVVIHMIYNTIAVLNGPVSLLKN